MYTLSTKNRISGGDFDMIKKIKKSAAVSLAALLMSSALVQNICADSVPVVTLGADLSAEQKNMIMSFFGTDENSVSVIEVTNQQERKYLEGLVANEIIGTRTLSCAYILPTTTGGIVVKTANLNWVTDAMLANSLLTCGVQNCQVIATAPFSVSGTGALTGVMVAYESSSGEALDESKKELATEELVITGELIDDIAESDDLSSVVEDNSGIEEADNVEISKYVIDMLNDMKTEALNGNISEETAEKIVSAYLEQYKMDISAEMKQKLVSYLMSFSGEDYDKSFQQSLDDLTERIKGGFDINIKGAADEQLSKFAQLWKNFVNWLKNLFGKITGKASDMKDDITDNIPANIFENVNTDIISYDEDPEELTGDADVQTDAEKSENSEEEQPVIQEEDEDFVSDSESDENVADIVSE